MGYVKDGSDIYMKNRSKTSRCSESSFSGDATTGDTALQPAEVPLPSVEADMVFSARERRYLTKTGKKLTSVATGQTPHWQRRRLRRAVTEETHVPMWEMPSIVSLSILCLPHLFRLSGRAFSSLMQVQKAFTAMSVLKH